MMSKGTKVANGDAKTLTQFDKYLRACRDVGFPIVAFGVIVWVGVTYWLDPASTRDSRDSESMAKMIDTLTTTFTAMTVTMQQNGEQIKQNGTRIENVEDAMNSAMRLMEPIPEMRQRELDLLTEQVSFTKAIQENVIGKNNVETILNAHQKAAEERNTIIEKLP